MGVETYYTLIGVSETATHAEIKTAYRNLIKQIHPDTLSMVPPELRRRAEEWTKELTDAYSVLSDPAQRQQYDRELAAYRQQSAPPPPPPPPATPPPRQGATQAPPRPTCAQCGTPLFVSVAPGAAHSIVYCTKCGAVNASQQAQTVTTPPASWIKRHATLTLLAVISALLILVLALASNSPQQPPITVPTTVGSQSGTPITDATTEVGKQRLLEHSRSCSLIQTWSVDFVGDGVPYRVERRHCNPEQLSDFALRWNGNQGDDFLLVIKPPQNTVVHGEMEADSYSSVKPIKLEGREYVILNGHPWGSGGYSDWCFLGANTRGTISCWQQQEGDLQEYIKPYLRSGERTKLGWSIIYFKDGDLFTEDDVAAPDDPNCCPSRGRIRVGFLPKDGVLYWGDVLRLSSPMSASANEELGDEIVVPTRITQQQAEALLVSKVAPEYPNLARQARVQGTVTLDAIIGKDGSVHGLSVASGHPMLVPAAIAAVKQWRYKPYYSGGEPLDVETQITVNFGLSSGSQ